MLDRGDQTVSRPCSLLLAAILLTLLASASLSLGGGLAWLSCLNVFSYIKLAITLVKYIPQAVANYRHKVRKNYILESVQNISVSKEILAALKQSILMNISLFPYNEEIFSLRDKYL